MQAEACAIPHNQKEEWLTDSLHGCQWVKLDLILVSKRLFMHIIVVISEKVDRKTNSNRVKE